jgi:hypothetical protein
MAPQEMKEMKMMSLDSTRRNKDSSELGSLGVRWIVYHILIDLLVRKDCGKGYGKYIK